jgi:hypothetical protein
MIKITSVSQILKEGFTLDFLVGKYIAYKGCIIPIINTPTLEVNQWGLLPDEIEHLVNLDEGQIEYETTFVVSDNQKDLVPFLGLNPCALFSLEVKKYSPHTNMSEEDFKYLLNLLTI